MEINKKDVGWRLWIQWVLAYAISFIVAWEQLWGAGKGSAIDAFLGRYMSYIIFGLITGFGQWLVLRRYGFSTRWIFATAVAAIIPLGGASLIGSVLLQTLILRQHTSEAVVWIFAYIPVIGLMALIGTLMGFFPSPAIVWHSLYKSYVLNGVIVGSVGALITGTALVWLLRHPQQVSNSYLD